MVDQQRPGDDPERCGRCGALLIFAWYGSLAGDPAWSACFQCGLHTIPDGDDPYGVRAEVELRARRWAVREMLDAGQEVD